MGAIRKNPPNKAAATIQDLAAKGHAIIGIAKALGVGRATFKRWCEEDDTLQEALAKHTLSKHGMILRGVGDPRSSMSSTGGRMQITSRGSNHLFVRGLYECDDVRALG